MDRLKVGEVAKSFNIDPQTVREWSEQFSEFLSPEANPPKGATRYYSPDDLMALAFVYQSRRGDATFDEIRDAMAVGQHRLTMPNLVPVPDSGLAGLGRGTDLARRGEDSEKLKGQLEAVTGERDYLREALKEEQTAHGATKEQKARAEAIAQERTRLLEMEQAKPKELPAPPAPAAPLFPKWLFPVLALALVLIIVLLLAVVVQGVGQ